MVSHVKAVAKKGKKVTVYSKNGYLYLNFMLDGKRKQKALKMTDTKKNRKVIAKEIIPQLEKKIALGEYGLEKQIKTFEYYAKFYLDQKRSLRSFKDKLPCYNKVISFFKNKNVSEITRFDVKRYLDSLRIRNKSKAVYKTTIKDILDLALDDGYIPYNPAANIKFASRDRKRAIKYFKKDEVITLINLSTEPLKTYLDIAFSTGLRPEEILGLKYSDIQNGFVKIQRVKRKGEIINDTKTQSSKRTIPFNVDLLNLDTNKGYLFKDIPDVSYFRKQWIKLLKNTGLEHRGIYNTRHTFATHLLKDNVVSISELSGLLGHTKVSTTLSYYASAIDASSQDIANKLKSFGYHSVTLDFSEKRQSA